jgi:hypothetical protein
MVSWEEARAETLLARMAQRQGKNLFFWSATRGLAEHPFPGTGNAADPIQALEQVAVSKQKALFVFKDFHPHFQDAKVIRRLRDLVTDLKSSYKTLVFLSPLLTIPLELEKDITVIDYDIPDFDEMAALVDESLAQAKGKVPFEFNADDREKIVQAALGMTLSEAENALARSIVDGPTLTVEEIEDTLLKETKQIIRKSRLLEYFEAQQAFADIGGLALFHDLDEIKPGEYDLIIVDPLCEAYPVKNENDNEEANVQMRLFRKLARSKQVAVMLVHNTGRPHYNHKTGEQSAAERATKKHMGRGATARADRADIGINYVAVDKTVRMLCVAKSRTPGHLGHQWVLDFDGNHGLKVRTVESHVSSHQNPPAGEIEIETSTLTTILHEHAGEGLQSIYDMYIKGTFPLSRATFYRRVQAIRMQPGSGATSPESP